MSTTDVRGSGAGEVPRVGTFDMKVEVVVVPVADVGRATAFYARLGWRRDVTPPGVVQFTPPGSGCSVHFGVNLTSAVPGSARGHLVVDDLRAARDALVAVGVDVDEVQHLGPDGPVAGPDPARHSYFSLATFRDPDGNSWVLQEVTTRLPGRVDPAATSFASHRDLADAMRRAEAAHAAHVQRNGVPDVDWPAWYAAYMIGEQVGTEPPT